MRWVHIVAGLIGIASGAVALVALKGAGLHRRSGMVFVYSMLVMSGLGTMLALAQPNAGNVVAGTMTFYMVATAVLTVRRPRQHARQIDILAMLAAPTLGIVCIGLGLFGDGDLRAGGGYPPPFYFVIGAGALSLALQDKRLIAAGGIQGTARLRRHLGRMSGAMLIATASFFLGQPKVFAGGPLEPAGLRAIPVIAVVAAMVYWRVRMRRPLAVQQPQSV